MLTDKDSSSSKFTLFKNRRGSIRDPRIIYQESSHSTKRFIALFEVILCSGFPTQLLLVQVMTAIGLQPFETDGSLAMNYVVVLSLADAVVLVMLILWLLALHGESPRDLFLGSRRIVQEFKFSILLIPLVLFLVVAASASLQHFAPWLHNVPENPYESLIQTTSDASIFALVAIIAGGVREEIQRAFILCRFERYLGGRATGVILFSLVFGAAHLIQGWDAAIITALLGALWSIVYLKRRSIIAPIVSHASFNVIQIIHHLIS